MERGGRFLNLGAINADGKTALQLAHEKGYYDIVRLIRSGGRYQEKKINIAFPSKETKLPCQCQFQTHNYLTECTHLCPQHAGAMLGVDLHLHGDFQAVDHG